MSIPLFSKAQKSLEQYWGFSSFLSGQDKAIRAVLEGNNTMVLLPTGGGKSLCYQVPATVFDGLTVVISPLVALMQDQVQQLNERGVAATFVNSSISSWEIEQRFANARNGMYDLLYCSPERLQTPLWEAEMPRLDIEMIAVDEAHCISEWGHDFRPSYREIRTMLETIADDVRWMALTATATPEVRKDIQKTLQLENPVIVSEGFDRPNLKWWVKHTNQKQEQLMRAVRRASPKGPGLIYGGTRRNCEELSRKIKKQLGIATEAYHAGIEGIRRRQIQEQWIAGELPLVVATNAFGMGIDKADCRYVIHYQMPYSLESYYQEAGRAGRDGKESFPLLLYKPSDAVIAKKRIQDSYPDREQLQHVYDVLCDYLNLAVGSEMENTEEASIEALKKRSGYPARIVKASLKVLNQLGILKLVEYISPQVGVQFVAAPDYIRNQINSLNNRKKADFIDVLFRQYGGEAFGQMKYMEFEYLQRKLAISPNAVKKGLGVLQDHDRMLQFEIIGEMPLVQLEEERLPSLNISKPKLEKHRNVLLKKLEYMKGYIETETCRERYIRSYFGEENVEPCGHCDNCLIDDRDSYSLSDSEIRKLRNMLKEGAKTFSQIQSAFGWNRIQTRKSLGYLIREDRVSEKAEKYYWKSS